LASLFTGIKDASTLSMLSQRRTGGTSKFVEYAQLGLNYLGDGGFLAPPEITMGGIPASHSTAW